MATPTEDDTFEQLDIQDSLFSSMETTYPILLQGIRQLLSSLFIGNDEEVAEYAVKPLLAQNGLLDDIDAILCPIYVLGRMDRRLYTDITHFSQYWHHLNEQDEVPELTDGAIWDLISSVNSIICDVTFYDVLKAARSADFAVQPEARFSGMVRTVLTLAVTTTSKELAPRKSN